MSKAEAEEDQANAATAALSSLPGTEDCDVQDLFRPSYDPGAANLDGKKRYWHKVGRSAIVVMAEENRNTGSGNSKEVAPTLKTKARGKQKRLQHVLGPVGSLCWAG